MDAYIAPLNRHVGAHQAAHPGRERHPRALLRDRRARAARVHTNAQLAAGAIRDCLQRGAAELVARVAAGQRLVGRRCADAGLRQHDPGRARRAADGDAVGARHLRGRRRRRSRRRRRASSWARIARALAVASEMPSRLFKRSRFAARGYDTDFDSHFLRWMLSDGAGALLLSDGAPALAGAPGLRLKLKWIHQRAFSRRLPGVHAAGPDRGPRSAVTWTSHPGPRPRPPARCRCGRTSGCCRTCSTSASTNTRGWCARLARSGAGRSFPVPLLVGEIHPGGRRPDATRPASRFRASAGTATWRGAATPARPRSWSCWPSSCRRRR